MTDLSDQRLADFLTALASDAPTPGGGTAAAVGAAMGAALAEMVAGLTLSREKYASVHEAVRPIAEAARSARARFLSLAGEDAESYEAVVAARRLPRGTEAEKTERDRAIAQATRRATEIPMRTARAAVELLALIPDLVEKGNPNAASDAGSAAALLESAAEAALLNVGVNLSGLSDAPFVAATQQETTDLREEAARVRSRVVAAVRRTF